MKIEGNGLDGGGGGRLDGVGEEGWTGAGELSRHSFTAERTQTRINKIME